MVLQDELCTPLHLAAVYGDVEVVSELIDSGANLDAKDIVSIETSESDPHSYEATKAIAKKAQKKF